MVPVVTNRKTPIFLPIIIILFISICIYSNTLFNDFVYDDTFIVVENPWIKDVSHLPDIFSKGLWDFQGTSGGGFYRPLVFIVYMLTYFVFGLKPWGFHFVNILLHAVVSVLVFLVSTRFFKFLDSPSAAWERLTPLLAGILFAAHPVHTEVVAWVSGVMDLLLSLFFLFSLHLYLNWKEKRGERSYVLSLLSFLLASLSKEPAIVLPVVLCVYDYVDERERFRTAHLKRYIPYFAIVGLYLLLRLNARVGIGQTETGLAVTFAQILTNVPALFMQYIWTLLIPVNLNVYHAFSPILSLSSWKAVFPFILTLGFVGLFVVAWKRIRAMVLPLCFLTLPLLPALYFPAVHLPFAERYLYLPSVGFAMILSYLAVSVVANRSGKAKLGIAVVTTTVILFYSVGAIKRNAVWESEFTLWTDATKKSPDQAMPYHNLGKALESMGRVDEAIEQYRIGLGLPSSPSVASMGHNNLGFSYQLKGDLDRAIAHYLTAIRFYPTETRVRTNLAVAYIEVGRIDEATEQLRIVTQIRPNDAIAHYNLGVVYDMKGLSADALNEFQMAEKFAPAGSELGKRFRKNKGY